jgi:hypothetical protein
MQNSGYVTKKQGKDALCKKMALGPDWGETLYINQKQCKRDGFDL